MIGTGTFPDGSVWAARRAAATSITIAALLGLGVAFRAEVGLVIALGALGFLMATSGRIRALVTVLTVTLIFDAPWILAPLLAGFAWVLWPDPSRSRREVIHRLATPLPRRALLVTVALGAAAGAGGAFVLYAEARPGFIISTVTYSWWVVGPGILLLAAANAIGEELLWRGALLSTQSHNRVWLLVLIQGASFGIAHFHGTPSGWAGVAVTSLFGVAAVTVRIRWGFTAGVLLHAIADAILFVEVMHLNGRHLF